MDKKQEIALKAGEMFMKYGIKSVSMDDLSRELAVSKKTIYTHFSDKNVLVEHVLKSHLDVIQKGCELEMEASANAIEQMFTIINLAAQDMNSIHPSVIFDLQKYYPKVWSMIEAHERDFILPFIRQNIQQGRQEGYYREDFDAEIVSQMYVSVNDSIFTHNIKGTEEHSIIEIFNESLRFILFGMASPEGKEYIRKHIINEK